MYPCRISAFVMHGHYFMSVNGMLHIEPHFVKMSKLCMEVTHKATIHSPRASHPNSERECSLIRLVVCILDIHGCLGKVYMLCMDATY